MARSVPGDDPYDPTNAVLAEKIDNLDRRLSDERQQEREYHSKLDGRFETLASMVATLTQQAAVDRARYDAVLSKDKERMDAHDKFHQEEAKAAAERKERGLNSTIALSSAISAAVAIIAVVVTVTVHV